MRKLITRLLSSIMVVFLLLPFFQVHANYSTNIAEEPITRGSNAYRIWSVMKGLGMNDYAAAGVLGNIFAESSADPTSIEGIYGEYGDANGAKKSVAFKDLSAYFRNDLVKKYINSGWSISGSSDNFGNTVPSSSGSGGNTINSKAYLGVDGKYIVGIGLIQFTGPRASRLVLWAESHGLKWYDMKAQLAYMLTKTDDKGYIDGKADYIIDTYAKTDYTNVDDATNDFMINVEGNTHNAGKRRELALDWYNRFHGDTGDRNYAEKVLKLANTTLKPNKENEDKSIVQDLIGPVVKMAQNTGFMFDIGKIGEKHANNAATEIYNSLKGEESKTKYSLYELFGSDIHFYRYMGEVTQTVGLVDHIYSNVKNGDTDFSLGDTVFYQSTRYLSANVYDDRPRVLTQQEITDGKSDARVFALSNSRFSGFDFVAGEFWLTVAKITTSFITLLMSGKPFEIFVEFFNKIVETGIWQKVMIPLLYLLTGYAIIFTIIRIIGHTIRFLSGKGTAFQIFQRFLSSAICIGIIFSLGNNPTTFSSILLKGTTFVDKLFDNAITMTFKDDDVISGSAVNNATEAAIWKKVIFEPWVVGQFGTTYDNLYTQFSTEGNKMYQSHATEAQIKNLSEGRFAFDSATVTGDVTVPVGNGKVIRNWAAYLYSVQSKYHIDFKDINGSRTLVEKPVFPNATTTAYDSTINADLFRVIDAQMDISPQIYSDGTKVENYTDSKQLEPQFLKQSMVMMLHVLILLIFLAPTIVKKLYYSMMLISMGVQFIFLSLWELAKENEGISVAWDKVKEYIEGYLMTSTRLFVFTFLFVKLVGYSLISTSVFIILGIVIYQITPDKIRNGFLDAKNKIDVARKYLARH